MPASQSLHVATSVLLIKSLDSYVRKSTKIDMCDIQIKNYALFTRVDAEGWRLRKLRLLVPPT